MSASAIFASSHFASVLGKVPNYPTSTPDPGSPFGRPGMTALSFLMVNEDHLFSPVVPGRCGASNPEPRRCLTPSPGIPGSRFRAPRNDGALGSEPHLAAGQILHDFLGAAADGVDLDLAVDALDLDARMKPAPPKICTASEAQNAMVCVAWFFIMQISATGLSPCPSRHASISSIACDAATFAPCRPACGGSPGAARAACQSLALLGIGDRLVEADAGIGRAARQPCPSARC